MKPAMNQTIVKVSAKTNKFGSITFDSSGSNSNLLGKFRNITDLNSNNQNLEQQGSDAMAWFNPDEDISRGDVLLADGEYFRVDKIVLARRLNSNVVQFIKCYLSKFKVVT